ncbi:hypothetical protein BZG36_05002, partial [Bifiguratus adelaidae]
MTSDLAHAGSASSLGEAVARVRATSGTSSISTASRRPLRKRFLNLLGILLVSSLLIITVTLSFRHPTLNSDRTSKPIDGDADDTTVDSGPEHGQETHADYRLTKRIELYQASWLATALWVGLAVLLVRHQWRTLNPQGRRFLFSSISTTESESQQEIHPTHGWISVLWHRWTLRSFSIPLVLDDGVFAWKFLAVVAYALINLWLLIRPTPASVFHEGETSLISAGWLSKVPKEESALDATDILELVIYPSHHEVANRAAVLGLTNFAFMVPLVIRNSIITRLTGLSYLHLIPLHKTLGRTGFALIAYHASYQISRNYEKQQGSIIMTFASNARHFWGTWTFAGVCTLAIVSHPAIRKYRFEFFYISHVCAYLVVMMAGSQHTAAFLPYMSIGFLLWVADRCLRYARGMWFSPQVMHDRQITRIVASDVLRLAFNLQKTDIAAQTSVGLRRLLDTLQGWPTYAPGQHAYIYIQPSVTTSLQQLLQSIFGVWHPYTIVPLHIYTLNHSSPMPSQSHLFSDADAHSGYELNELPHTSSNDSLMESDAPSPMSRASHPRYSNSQRPWASSSTVSLPGSIPAIAMYIQNLGSFSSKLLTVASSSTTAFDIHMDGPYGTCALPRPFAQFPCVAFVCTGIGITPGLVWLKDLAASSSSHRVRHIYLIWSLRHVDMYRAFTSELDALSHTPSLSITMHIHITRSEISDPAILTTRPDIPALLKAVKFSFPDCDTAMFAFHVNGRLPFVVCGRDRGRGGDGYGGGSGGARGAGGVPGVVFTHINFGLYIGARECGV